MALVSTRAALTFVLAMVVGVICVLGWDNPQAGLYALGPMLLVVWFAQMRPLGEPSSWPRSLSWRINKLIFLAGIGILLLRKYGWFGGAG